MVHNRNSKKNNSLEAIELWQGAWPPRGHQQLADHGHEHEGAEQQGRWLEWELTWKRRHKRAWPGERPGERRPEQESRERCFSFLGLT